MVTLHEVITFLVSMQISISSLQTHNVNRCGRSRHLARKLSLRRKRSSPNVFEMAATETITSIILISPVEFIAAVIAYYVHPVNIQTACLIMEGAEFTENIINGVERPVKAAELFAFTLRVRAGNTDV